MTVFTLFVFFCALLPATLAHSMMQQITKNGQPQGITTAIRMSANNGPIQDVYSDQMTCGNGNNEPVADYISVSPGDEVGFQWRHDRGLKGIVMTAGHWGSIAVFAAPAASNGKGNVWVKLVETGLPDENGDKPFDDLRKNDGIHTVKVPDLKEGDYLFRAELLSLQQAMDLNGFQYYISCAQIRVTGNGKHALPSGVAIPGSYDNKDPAILFTGHRNFVKGYKQPGGAPVVFEDIVEPIVKQAQVKAQTSSSATEPESSTTQAEKVAKATNTPKPSPAAKAPAPKSSDTDNSEQKPSSAAEAVEKDTKAYVAAPKRKCLRRRSPIKKRAEGAYVKYLEAVMRRRDLTW